MKRIVTKVLASLMCVALILAMTPLSGLIGLSLSINSFALESGDSCGDSATYTFDSSTGLLVISGSGEIKERAFYGKENIKNVIINFGITSIKKSAFSNLVNVTFPDSLTSIGDSAFYYCYGLTSVTIPDSVTEIGNIAFYHVNNVSYTNNMEATGSPWGAKIANGYVDGSIVYNDSSESAIYGCSSTTIGDIIISDTVKSIEASAFYGCDKITSVTLSNSVTNIGSFAFYCCTALKNVMFGNQLISIGNHAFFACDSITEITIPNSVKSIGLNTFNLCTGLINITISDGVKEIGNNAFGYVNNISYTSNMKATGSPWGAKCVNGYTDGYLVYGNAEKTSIYGCSTTVTESITLPKTVTSIEKNAFYKCDNFTSIALPDSLTNIGEYAFYYCRRLTEITIPSNVAIISENAFMACHGLKSLRISEGMTDIKKSAFSYCMNLEEIFYSGTEEQWKQIVIDDDNEYLVNAKIHYLADIIYKISYNANGGTVQPLSDNVSPLKPVTLPTPTKMYTVSYNANGGSGAPDSQNIYVPCKGWSKNSEATDAEYACGGSFTTAGDITLYAVWDNDVTTTVTSVSSTRLGYTFCGWSTNSKATSADVKAGSNLSVSKNITLYAVWEEALYLKSDKYKISNENDYSTDTNSNEYVNGDKYIFGIKPAIGAIKNLEENKGTDLEELKNNIKTRSYLKVLSFK